MLLHLERLLPRVGFLLLHPGGASWRNRRDRAAVVARKANPAANRMTRASALAHRAMFGIVVSPLRALKTILSVRRLWLASSSRDVADATPCV
jgi:hypothetical protein